MGARPARWRDDTTARRATTTTIAIQLIVGSMVPYMRWLITATLDEVPASGGYPEKGPKLSTIRHTPLAMRKPASVTMNEGMRRRVIRVPWRNPHTPTTASPTTIAAHHGQFVVLGCTSCTAIAPPSGPT